jgi:glycosyltransferase involved in cell wall biosynthesis
VTLRRLMFASCHAYVDPLSDAAWAARGVLRLLAGRGVDCRALTAGALDGDREVPLRSVLDAAGTPYGTASAELSGAGSVEVIDLELDGVRVTMLPTASSRVDRAPDRDEATALLDLALQALARFRPQALVVSGGHPADLELMAAAGRLGVPVVAMPPGFAPDRRAFADAAAVLVPSEYARRYYADRLGLGAVAIPPPVDPARLTSAGPEPRYLTFIDPRPAKGSTVFARIAAELGAKRPDVPILVVEGRAEAGELARAGPDLSGLASLHRMAAGADPREVYSVTRALLVPTLIREAFGRSAAEALAAGVPVLASDRGALPETLGEAGFLFTIPDRCTPSGEAAPGAREVAAWVATVLRLWDDAAWEAEQRSRAAEAARRYAPEALAGRYVEFFEKLGRSG